jgi:hypothetical protein
MPYQGREEPFSRDFNGHGFAHHLTRYPPEPDSDPGGVLLVSPLREEEDWSMMKRHWNMHTVNPVLKSRAPDALAGMVTSGELVHALSSSGVTCNALKSV